MKYRDAAIAVFAFALGVLVMHQANDYTPKAQACREATDNAERYARAIAAVLNGGAIYTDDVIASCRVTNITRRES